VDVGPDFHELQHALCCLPQHNVCTKMRGEKRNRSPLQMATTTACLARAQVYAFAPR
jgi:hypothetical protein